MSSALLVGRKNSARPPRRGDIEEEPVPSTVRSIISTADPARLLRFYAELFGAQETERFPEEGPTFFVGLRIGDSDLGVVAAADTDTDAGDRQRMLLSVEVDDVDRLLARVEPCGGHVLGPSNDMPWGQRVAHVQDPDGNAVNLTQPI